MDDKNENLLYNTMCAMMPYGISVPLEIYSESEGYVDVIAVVTAISTDHRVTCEFDGYIESFPISEVKPYLRPIDDMTDEERKEYDSVMFLLGCNSPLKKAEWLLEHHFDTYGFIDMGIATEYRITKK